MDGLEIEQLWEPGDRDAISDLLQEFDEEDLNPDKKISDLKEVIDKSDKKGILEKLTIGLYISGLGAALPIPDDGIGIPPRLGEYVIGLIIDSELKGEKETSYQALAESAQEVADAYLYSDMVEGKPERETEEEKLRRQIQFNLKLREVTAGRFLYWEQPIIAARKAYKPHDEVLLDEVGFTIEDAIDFTYYIEEILDNRVRELYSLLAESDIDVFSEKDTMESLWEEFNEKEELPRPTEREDFKRDMETMEAIIHELSGELDALWLSEEDLVETLPEKHDKSRFRNYLDRMSVEVAEWEHPIDDEFRTVDQFNPLHSYPLVKYDDRIIVPHPTVHRRALKDTFYYDLIQSEEYGDATGETGGQFGDIWGEYLESWTYECTQKLLENVKDDSRILLNPKYEDNGVENEAADIVLLHNKTVIVIECKTKPLTVETRGGDYQAVSKDVRDGIEAGGRQANELIDDIQSGRIDHLYTETEEIEIKPDELSFYFPIVILGEQYDSLATILFDRVIKEGERVPYVTDIFSLQVMTEVFTALDFIKYVSERKKLVKQKTVVSEDEIDYLGLFLLAGKEFPDLPENTFVFVKDMSQLIGQAINFKFGP